MAKPNYPVTPAIRALREAGIDFVPHLYRYQDKGGSARSSAELGVGEHQVIKTLVMQDQDATPMVVLMHGDRQVSTKQLARHLGIKSVAPCTPAVADRHSGYQVGGTSPLGTRRAMPIYAEATIADLPQIFINGGKRGFLVEVAPQPLLAALNAQLVQVAV